MNACSTCKAPVVWVKTTGGKFTPVDAERDGSPLVNVDGARLRVTTSRAANGQGGTVPVVETLGDLELAARPAADELRYRSHFVTCPQADTHRKKAAG